ncbi:hypothetical protein [Streptomyces sp. NPDC012756]|uniref:hypothetical protein n=1 Tax=unclassified Streptomyces TaxID=2593676 RepID=UPI0036AC2C1B
MSRARCSRWCQGTAIADCTLRKTEFQHGNYHGVASGALAAPAASLGAAVDHVDDRLPSGSRRPMCGSLAVFLAVGLLAGALSGRGTRWIALVRMLFPTTRRPWLYEKRLGDAPEAERPGAVPDRIAPHGGSFSR